MIAFIDDLWKIYGVGPICRVLPIAPSVCYVHAARRADQTLQERLLFGSGLVFYSDLGAQLGSIRHTECLAEASIEHSVESVSGSHVNALSETVIGLFQAEALHRREPWPSFEAIEFSTLKWVDYFNDRGLLKLIDNVPLPGAKARFVPRPKVKP